MQPLDVVKACYEAFGRGDIPRLLGFLAEDISWIDPGYPDVPYAGPRRGSAQVLEFFAGLNEHVEFTAFEPRVFVTQDAEVAVFGAFSGRGRKTGKVFSSEWCMRWRVENGRVVLYQAYTDTNAVAQALGSR